MTAPSLSKHWRVTKQHASIYTDSSAKVDRSWYSQHGQSNSQTVNQTNYLMACWNAGDIAIVDTRSGQLIRSIKADEDDDFITFAMSNVQTITQSESQSTEQSSTPSADQIDGKIATVSRRSMMCTIWSLQSGDALLSFKTQPPHTQPLIDCSFDPSDRYLATLSIDRSIKVFDITNGSLTHSFQAHTNKPTILTYHPNVKRLEVISGDEEGRLVVCSLKKRSSTVLSSEHLARVTRITFSEDGRLMITAGADSVINVWDTQSNYNHLKTITAFELIDCLNVWPSNCPLPQLAKPKKIGSTVIIAGGEKGIIRLFDSVSGQVLYSHELPKPAVVKNRDNDEQAVKSISNQLAHLFIVPSVQQSVKQTEDSQQPACNLLAITREQNFILFDPSTFKQSINFVGFNDEIIDVRFLPDGERAVVATNSAQVRVFNLNNMNVDMLSGHGDTVLSIDVDSTGRFVCSSSKDRTVRVFDLKFGGRCVAIAEGHTESVGACSFSKLNNQSNKLFIISGARDRTLKMWNAAVLSGLPDDLPQDFTPLVLDCLSTRVAHEKDINSVTVAPNDRMIASASEDRTIQLSSNQSLGSIATLKGHRRGVWCVRFSPMDKVLASASGDKTVKLWSLTDFSCLRSFEGHTGSVKSLAFLNSGLQLASAGDDGVVRLWLIKTNECVATLMPPGVIEGDLNDPAKNPTQSQETMDDDEEVTDKLWALDISKDGSRMITGGTCSIINVWNDVTATVAESEVMEKEQSVLSDQKLMSLIRAQQYDAAFKLAVSLKQPRRLHQIVAAMTKKSTSQQDVDAVVVSFSPEDLSVLLTYLRDWNTNAKTARVANQLMASVLRVFPTSMLMKNKIWSESLSSMILHCQRHAQRLDRLVQKSFIWDFALESMNVLTGVDSGESDDESGDEEQHEKWRLTEHATIKIEEIENDDDQDDWFQPSSAPLPANSSRILSASVLDAFKVVEEAEMEGGEDVSMESNWDGMDEQEEQEEQKVEDVKNVKTKKNSKVKSSDASNTPAKASKNKKRKAQS